MPDSSREIDATVQPATRPQGAHAEIFRLASLAQTVAHTFMKLGADSGGWHRSRRRVGFKTESRVTLSPAKVTILPEGKVDGRHTKGARQHLDRRNLRSDLGSLDGGDRARAEARELPELRLGQISLPAQRDEALRNKLIQRVFPSAGHSLA